MYFIIISSLCAAFCSFYLVSLYSHLSNVPSTCIQERRVEIVFEGKLKFNKTVLVTAEALCETFYTLVEGEIICFGYRGRKIKGSIKIKSNLFNENSVAFTSYALPPFACGPIF